jgi:hypothetical protein
MSDNRPTRDSMSLEEATVSNMLEIVAIIEHRPAWELRQITI